jgi:phosphatidylglycerophosphatase A
MDRLATFLATWGYSGLIRPAPGTWGTLAAMPFAWALVHWGNAFILGLAILLVFLIGLWATARHMTATQNPDDPSEVVIDEVAGVWVACLALPDASAGGLIGAFLLFRLFDIWKRGPVGWADRRLKGAFGVMADDLIAGAMAAVSLALILRLLEVAL